MLVTASETATTPGQVLPIQIFVGASYAPAGNTVPTGGVSVSVDGALADSSLAFSETLNLTQAFVAYDFVAPAAAGSHLITVTYPGDGSDSLGDSEAQGIHHTVVLIGTHKDKKYVGILSNARRVFEIDLRFALIPR